MKPTIVPGSKILILGDTVTTNDLVRQSVFSGSDGEELARQLHEAGILKTECSLAAVSRRPKLKNDTKHLFKKKTLGEWIPDGVLMQDIEHAWKLIEEIQPNLIIALGELALYTVTGHKSVAKWRGSILAAKPALPHIIPSRTFKVIATYHPVAIMRMWPWRHIAVKDLRRCAHEAEFPEDRVPGYLFHVRPTFAEATEYLKTILAELDKAPLLISNDIETIARQIACVGFALNKREAMCIPILTKDNPEGYWSAKEELAIILLIREIFMHPNADVFGQNFLYDIQYYIRYWGVKPKLKFDTMVGWHVLFPGEKKSLDFISSLLCEHYSYWKDELQDYKSYPLDEETFWRYNCKDVVYTMECRENITTLLEHAHLWEPFNFQMSIHEPVLQMMLRGVLIDTDYKKQLGMSLWDLTAEYQTLFNRMLPADAVAKKAGAAAWYDSPTQLSTLFYDQCKLPVQRDKKTRKPTTNDAALVALQAIEPALTPLLQSLQEYRSIGVFNNNFVATPLEKNRMHCSFAIAGPETFRFSSSKDAFGYGTNLQNIPSGTEAK